MLAWMLWVGCGETAPPAVAPPAAATACPGQHAWVGGARAPWERASSAMVAALGPARHFVQDALLAEGAPLALHAKFAYGPQKDLEGERVRAWIETCDGWVLAAEGLTDDDGRATLGFPRALSPGDYPVRVEVPGDGTTAEARVWVRPKGSAIAVFDLDGTLSRSDEELALDLEGELRDGYDPVLYPGAVALTEARAAEGDTLVYLTGRPYWLGDLTRGWVAQIGLAPAITHFADASSEIVTADAGVGEYKLAFLRSLQAQGFVVAAAHGNATTDIYAYVGAGIPLDRVFVIGPHGGEQGTAAQGESWEPLVARLRAAP